MLSNESILLPEGTKGKFLCLSTNEIHAGTRLAFATSGLAVSKKANLSFDEAVVARALCIDF
jgi:hypothetical protein